VTGEQLSFDGRQGVEGPKVFSVSELVRRASRRLESGFGDVWVEGEVSNLKTPSSGHVYFTLKDARAQLAVVIFRSACARLKFRIEDGLLLRCRGHLHVYEPQGRFQLAAETAEPAGLGALQLAFEQLKRKLEAEGLFDAGHKKPLPRLPRAVAVVTSPTGAALRDILRVLHARFPVRVVVSPTPVQGSEAPEAIAAALRRADRFGADLIIVGRGGGSLEDLWAFNTEVVARAIFAARTPLISAVGHEVDVTISDLVADQRAPTPSAAAEMAVPVRDELLEQLAVCRSRLTRTMRHTLEERRWALERLRRQLVSPAELVNRGRMALDDATSGLQQALTRRLARRREALLQLRARLAAQEPRARLARHRAALAEARQQLVQRAGAGLARRRAALEQATARLEALSPLAVLERGYGLVLDENRHVVRDLLALAPGQRLVLRLRGGEVCCVVETVSPSER
jgi:exodeoxyribonuclease VII large subunit